jgi:hypothetical protein
MIRRATTILAVLAGLLLGAAGRAAASSSATINIEVTINAPLSVSVNSLDSSTDTVTWNVASGERRLSGSSVTVTNDTGGLTEKWALSTNANSIDTGAGGGAPGSWTLSTSSNSVGVNEFAVQAVFGSSNTAAGGCPAVAAADWDQSYAPPLTTSPQTYTSTVFADPNLTGGGLGGTPNPDNTNGAADGQMFNGSSRALCWRLMMPSQTSVSTTQNIQITVTAQLP